MKLGTQTASVVNNIYSRGVIGQPALTVGMGATELLWTDRHALTIVEIVVAGPGGKGESIWSGDSIQASDIKRIATTQDNSKVIAGSGHDGSAEYEYTSNLDGHRTWWRVGKGGLWESIRLNEESGRWVKHGERGLRIGEREEYRDPSF